MRIMISHLINSPTAIGVFTAVMGAITCTAIAFANRRDRAYCPGGLLLAYRATWLATAGAWALRGVTIILGLDNSPATLVPTAAILAGALVGLYLGFQMRRYWPFANR